MNLESANSYIVTLEIDGSERQVTIDDYSSLCNESDVAVAPTDVHGLYIANVDGERIPCVIKTDGVSSLTVSMRGYVYETKVRSSDHHALLDILRRSPAMKSRTVNVQSPMPGLLKGIHTSVGATVTKGTMLFTLEAMKMENAITSPIAGTIKSVSASEGKAVEKGALLCVIDPA